MTLRPLAYIGIGSAGAVGVLLLAAGIGALFGMVAMPLDIMAGFLAAGAAGGCALVKITMD